MSAHSAVAFYVKMFTAGKERFGNVAMYKFD